MLVEDVRGTVELLLILSSLKHMLVEDVKGTVELLLDRYW